MATKISTSLPLCIVAISVCNAQLAFHTDPQTNTFSLKAPGYQTTFTKYFGGQQPNLFGQQQQAASQQKQQIVAAPQNYYQSSQGDLDQAYQQAYSAQQQEQQASASQQQPQQQQQQYLSAQEYAAYLHQQTQEQQQLQYAEQQQQVSVTRQIAQRQRPQTQPFLPQTNAQLNTEQQVNSNLLGVAYSPSNKVSHVKFSSGGLAYNF